MVSKSDDLSEIGGTNSYWRLPFAPLNLVEVSVIENASPPISPNWYFRAKLSLSKLVWFVLFKHLLFVRAEMEASHAVLVLLVEVDLLDDDELATALEVTSQSGQLHGVARVAVLHPRVRAGLQQLADDVLVAQLGRDVERGLAEVVDKVVLGASHQQPGHAGVAAVQGGTVEGRLAALGLHVDQAGVALQEELHAALAVRGGGAKVKRKLALFIHFPDALGPGVEKLFQNLLLPIQAGNMQGRVPTLQSKHILIPDKNPSTFSLTLLATRMSASSSRRSWTTMMEPEATAAKRGEKPSLSRTLTSPLFWAKSRTKSS